MNNPPSISDERVATPRLLGGPDTTLTLGASPALGPTDRSQTRPEPHGIQLDARIDGHQPQQAPYDNKPQDGPHLKFSDHFWGKEDAGLDVILGRLRRGKLVSKEFKDLMVNRASLEEEYGKKLVKLSKSSCGDKEEGTLRNSLDVLRAEIERTGKNHLELAQLIRKDLDLKLVSFMFKQRETRKPVATSMEKTLKAKVLAANAAVKAREKYETECIKANGLSATKNTVSGKEYEKTKAKLEKTEQSARTADRDYANAVDKLSDIAKRWETEWRTALDKFQKLEFDRIQFLKEMLWLYTNLVSTVCVKDDESCERVRKSLELCSPGPDIDMFISTKGTGKDIPEPLGYLNFFTGTPDREAGILPSASFSNMNQPVPAPQEQIDQRWATSTGSGGDLATAALTGPGGIGSSEPFSTQNVLAAASDDSLNQMFPGLPAFESGQSLSADLASYYPEPSGVIGGSMPSNTTGQRSSTTSFDIMDPRSPYRAPDARVRQDTAYQSELPHHGSDGRPILFFVKCLYDYTKAIPEELDLKEGDTLSVLATQEDGWWEGEVVLPDQDSRRRIGLFPSNFTVLL